MADDAAAAGEVIEAELAPTDPEQDTQPDTDASDTQDIDEAAGDDTSNAKPPRRPMTPLRAAALVGAVSRTPDMGSKGPNCAATHH